MIEQNNLQNNNENNNNDNNNMILSTNSIKNNPIVNTLIDLGFDPTYSKRLFIYFHPENIEEAIEYLSKENEFIQHTFVQDRNFETSLCYVCGQEKNIHINNNIQLNNNNEEDNKNISDLELKSNENEGQNIECSSCEELFIETKENKLEKCGHSFCNDCWFNYFSVKINENKIGLIKCIEYECEEKPDDDFVINLIKSDQILVEKYKKFKYEFEINQNKKFCPFPNCNSFLELKDINNKEVKCSNNHTFCFICLEKPHGNSPCKENLLKSSMAEYSKNNLIKRCPKCSTITEKVVGCNHITCTKCNYEWCWLCNGEIDPEHYLNGKCRGYQFFRPKNEEEIKLAFERKIELRESQRQEDLEESEITVIIQNNSVEFQRRNLFISNNDIPAQNYMNKSVDLLNNLNDDQNDDDNNIMNNVSNNENENNDNSNLNNNMSNEQNNADFNIGNNENNNINNNNDNLFNNKYDEIENKNEDEVKIYDDDFNNSNKNISNGINNNEKNDLIDSSYYNNKNKEKRVSIQNINKEKNNVVEQNVNNDLNQLNLSNKNYDNFINYNIINNNNNNFNKRYFESSEQKDDFENKYNNENLNNSILNHENNINNKLDIKNVRMNHDTHLINNNNNNQIYVSEVEQINQIFIYKKNNIIDDDKKEKEIIITSNKLIGKENEGNNEINNNDTLYIDEQNSDSRFNEKNKKKNKNEIKNSQLSISYKILLTIIYILFGHCFILTNIFLEIIKKDYYKLPFLFIIIPYFFIQILINILLFFPYLFKGFDSFLSEFWYIIKFKYNNMEHFLSITNFSYYSAEILFLGTFLFLIKLISKLLHKKNIFSILSGIILGLVFLPFHIIINLIMLIFAFCHDEYNPKYMINKLSK